MDLGIDPCVHGNDPVANPGIDRSINHGEYGPASSFPTASRELAILVPACNEAETLPGLVRELRTQGFSPAQIVIVNDCSDDATLEVARGLGVAALDLPIRLGIGGAMQVAYRWALRRGFARAVQIDGDGQHDPAAIFGLIEAAETSGAELVIGSRFIEPAREGFRSTPARRLGIQWFSALIRVLTGFTIRDTTSGMRLVGRDLMARFAVDYPADFPEPETLAWALTARRAVVEVPVRMRARAAGRSSIRGWISAWYAVKVTMAIVFGCAAGAREGRRVWR